MKLREGWAALVCGLIFVIGATFAPVASGANPWLQQHGVMNMAHQGGEMEAPSSTMYAFHTALRDRGADTLELDVNATADDRLAVIHDADTARITPVDRKVREITLAELQDLDAGWWFSPEHAQFNHSLPESDYPFRGVRTGDRPPPDGYSPDDFRVPAIEEVLAAFPKVPINIEIKTVAGEPAESIRVATLLAEILNRPENRNHRIIVASLDQAALEKFHELAPHVGVSASLGSMIGFITAGTPIEPRPVALQVPSKLGDLDLPRELQAKNANGLGFAVHAWTENLKAENEDVYRHLVETGLQGIMSSAPSRLHRFLCRNGIRRPDGSPRCATQRLKARLRLPNRSLNRALRGGLPVRLNCSNACSARLVLRMKSRAARLLGIKGPKQGGAVVVGVRRRGKARRGSTVLRVRFSRQARKRLHRTARVRVALTATVFDETGWRSRVIRRQTQLRKAGRNG